MRRLLRDPVAPSLVLFGALVVAGFTGIALGWRVAARTLAVFAQTPALVSGGLGGLSLILIGAALLNVQVARRAAAVERVETEAVLDEAAELLRAVKARR